MKPLISIVCYNQFGYLTDTYEYCKYLSRKYDIEYICIDASQDKLIMEGVNVIYLKTQKKGALKWLEFVNFSNKNISKNSQFVFIKYSLFCSLLSFKYRKKAIFDVRTGSLKKSHFWRKIENLLILSESLFFRYKSVISESLAKKLNIGTYILLPLGANTNTLKYKNFIDTETVKLLYIGTFSGRKIDDVLHGFQHFLQNNVARRKVTLDLVGDGYKTELQSLKDLANKLGIDKSVKFHGRIPYKDTLAFLDMCNVGISYVPKTSFFDVQPVTKTFEYFASGMPVLGTSTSEQSKVIDSDTLGVLCHDNPVSFSLGLNQIVESFGNYNSEEIKKISKKWGWELICKDLENHIAKIKLDG